MTAKTQPYVIVNKRPPIRFDTSVRIRCPRCLADAIVPLPPRILARQTDGTTHACLPTLGGCGYGAKRT